MSEEEIFNQRKEKVHELRKNSIEPYPYRFEKKNSAKEAIENYKGLKPEEKTEEYVSIAGRLTRIRIMGKALFADVQDQTGKLQVYVKSDEVGENAYNIFTKLIDIGDIIGIHGKIFKTKTGELSVWAKKYELLAKSLRPMPEKWHGLQDVEIRYRKRYLDIIANPDVKETFFKRAEIISAIREFMKKKGFIEVEIPILQPLYGGAKAKPFKTHINAWNLNMYLSVSPELYLKRLLVGGFEKVYTISKNFRNEGVDKSHNPEFTMFECYQAYADYEDMMKLLEDLVGYVLKKLHAGIIVDYQGTKLHFKKKWQRLSMLKAIKKYTKNDVGKMDDEKIKQLMKVYNIEYDGDYIRGLAIEKIFDELVSDKLIQPVHITDHPIETTPLCKPKRGNSNHIERFESFVNGMELSNAYSELNEPILQRKLLKEQSEQREEHEENYQMDNDFVEAIEYGMPPAGGLGIGIDRLVMMLTNSRTIRDVILFPTMKKEGV
ncbi:lysine--tRNA ligase [Candidatus Woesearchaeota archaeon]|nr:lysine--tRNA ligase [Candidatus Woesearchaeota archaeon]